MNMRISMIAACSENRVIGRDNDLVWHLPDDLRFFKQMTLNRHIVMGRKTWDSVGKALPHRVNFVVSRRADFDAPGAVVFQTLEAAISAAKKAGETELMIVGGAEIYRLAMPLADRIYLTEIKGEFEGDTFFPEMIGNWKETARDARPADEKHAFGFDFVTYEREPAGS